MKNGKYYLLSGLMAFCLSPVLIPVAFIPGALLSMLLGEAYLVVLGAATACIGTALLWTQFCRLVAMPPTWFSRLAPIMLAFAYYMIAWISAIGASQYAYEHSAWTVFFYLTLPYFLPNLLSAIGVDFSLFPVMQLVSTLTAIAAVLCACRKWQPKATAGRGVCFLIALFIAITGAAGYQSHERATRYLASGGEAERIDDQIDLAQYRPFWENSSLARMDGDPAIAIHDDYPRLDGATAAYPVYGAVAQAVYKGLDEHTVGEYVHCSQTGPAYERLIAGETDIFFGAQPSETQRQLAAESGLEFQLLPVAREAFVFFVHAENPVTDLSIGQIRDIYSKRITNWRILGGNDEGIVPFQRPENSGSQTIMQAVVMEGAPLTNPLREEYAELMGGVINQVAAYRNNSSSIGYSFRYFVDGMHPHENIRLLAIDGVEPTIETIRDGSYPFVVEVYAVTAQPRSDNTQRLLDWLVSEEGQDFIETCGYVRR